MCGVKGLTVGEMLAKRKKMDEDKSLKKAEKNKHESNASAKKTGTKARKVAPKKENKYCHHGVLIKLFSEVGSPK